MDFFIPLVIQWVKYFFCFELVLATGKHSSYSDSIMFKNVCFIGASALYYFGPVYITQSMLKVNNRKTRTRCQICSKLTIKIPERRRSGNFIVNFEHISHLVLVFLLLTLNMHLPTGYWLIGGSSFLHKFLLSIFLYGNIHITKEN